MPDVDVGLFLRCTLSRSIVVAEGLLGGRPLETVLHSPPKLKPPAMPEVSTNHETVFCWFSLPLDLYRFHNTIICILSLDWSVG